MKIEQYKDVLNKLGALIWESEFRGHVYSVGGCERDRYLGMDIKDIDLVVDLPNGGIRLAEWLYEKGYLIYAPVTYENYGTAMFHLKSHPDIELEAVQTRKESYRDMTTRNPETAFGTIQEDCMRRDFTMNALYRMVGTDELFDFTGRSIDDIKERTIRSCDDPNIIFKEDPLRILRALRFKAKLGWSIDVVTYSGMLNNVDRLEIISTERITDEFDKILACDAPGNVLRIAHNIGVLKYICPLLAGMDDHAWDDAINSLTYSMKGRNERVPILFYYADKSKVRQALRDMKYPNDFIDDCVFVINEIPTVLGMGKTFDDVDVVEVRKLQNRAKYDRLIGVLVFSANAILNKDVMYGVKRNPQVMHVLSKSLLLQHIGEDCFVTNVPVDGNDVMDMKGLEPGKKVSEYIAALKEEWFKNPKISRVELLRFLSNLTL